MKSKPPRASEVGPLKQVKIFLSHAHEDSVVVEGTADALKGLGLRPFVAARDIHPAKQWLPRLESELRNSDALAAFLTSSFRASAWSDQEVGYALGLGKKVLPILISPEVTPYGFLERYQAVFASAMNPPEIAVQVFDWLLRYEDMQNDLGSIIISKLNSERSQSALRLWMLRLAQVENLSATNLKLAKDALKFNALIGTDLQLRSDIESQLRRLSESA